MPAAAITANIDVAQLVLYAFWIFFAGLIYYLHREDKREGYVKEKNSGDFWSIFVPPVPEPKTYYLTHGGTTQAPRAKEEDPYELKAKPTAPWAGAPLEPTGNPLKDGVGPASYAMRSNEPEQMDDGGPKIQPLRTATDFYLESRDPDPRGMTLVGADDLPAGKISDVWVDKGEYIARYFEADLDGGGKILVPTNFLSVSSRKQRVKVRALTAAQLADVPALGSPDSVTIREEDKIMGYYAGGKLYATPGRLGPIL